MGDRLQEIRERHGAATLDWRIYGEVVGVQAVIQLTNEDVPWLLAEVERLRKLEAAVRYYHQGHGYIERGERWRLVRALVEGEP